MTNIAVGPSVKTTVYSPRMSMVPLEFMHQMLLRWCIHGSGMQPRPSVATMTINSISLQTNGVFAAIRNYAPNALCFGDMPIVPLTGVYDATKVPCITNRGASVCLKAYTPMVPLLLIQPTHPALWSRYAKCLWWHWCMGSLGPKKFKCDQQWHRCLDGILLNHGDASTASALKTWSQYPYGTIRVFGALH